MTTTLQELTRTDPLTELDNRRALQRALKGLAAGGGVLLLDLDHFKLVNDTWGHRHGDEVLQDFAQLLRKHAPHAVSTARYGGEEFAVVLAADARNTGVQVFTELRAAWQARGLTFSAGLAQHREGGSSEETLEAADRALYRAKGQGRDQLVHAPDVARTEPPPTAVQVTSPVTPQVVGQRIAYHDSVAGTVARGEGAPSPRAEDESAPLTLAGLDEVLHRGLVTPHYQPVVDAGTGRVTGVEALARVTHPDTGQLLLPGQFLALAERTGRVGELDRQVAGAAIAQVATWRTDPSMTALSVAVNISIDHLDEGGLAHYLTTRCQRAGLPTAAVTVEITETLQSVTGRGHEHLVQLLRNAGLQVVLDDFGTGFSALSYLLRFPVTGIKIDQSFTATLTDTRGQQLVEGILSTARVMGLDVVAEGVETPQQRGWLTTHHCPHLQGYLLSTPLPSHALPAMVTTLENTPARDAPERHAQPSG